MSPQEVAAINRSLDRMQEALRAMAASAVHLEYSLNMVKKMLSEHEAS